MAKVLHITNNDYDGAGRAVLRLNNSLIDNNINSKILVLYKKSIDENVITIGSGKTLKELFITLKNKKLFCSYIIYRDFIKLLVFRLKNILLNIHYKPKNLFNFYSCALKIRDLDICLDGIDVLIFHSIQDMISIENIYEISKRKKIRIIFHPLDMEMITGGYHFSFDCECYKNGICDSEYHNMNKLANKMYSKKVLLLSKIPIMWIATNNFILNRIKSSNIYSRNHNSKTIFMSMDKSVYTYNSKSYARSKFSVDNNKKVILFGCFNFMDKRKNADLLNKIVHYLESNVDKLDNILFLTFGDLNGFNLLTEKVEWTHLGNIVSANQLNLLYRLADIMINPSLDDIGPTTLQEALLNDLYIVSFNMGIAADLIAEGINGNIINNFDNDKFISSVVNKLDNLNKKNSLENEKIIQIKKSCKYDSEAKEFIKVFRTDN